MQGDCDNMEGKPRRCGEEVQVQAAIWFSILFLSCGWWPQQPQACTAINQRYIGDWLVVMSGILISFSHLRG